MTTQLLAYVVIAASLALLLRLSTRIRQREEATVPKLQYFPDQSPRLGKVGTFDSWFLRLCYFCGNGVNPLTVVLGIALTAVLALVIVFMATRDPVFAVVSAILWVASLLLIMSIVRHRALKQFEGQFPAALDLFARAIRAGESVDQAMHLLADAKVGEPSRMEFRRCARHLDMGLSLPATLRSLCERIDLTDVKIFSSAMSAHRDGGGNLAGTLERLASVIRDRVNYRQQLKAVTGASRISVFLIAGLGPVLFGWLFFVHPEYGSRLWNDATGRLLLIYAVVSELIGLLVVGALVRSDY